MTTITIVLEDDLAHLIDNAVQQSSSSPEEIVKQAIYHYFSDLQKLDAGDDPLVGLLDLGIGYEQYWRGAPSNDEIALPLKGLREEANHSQTEFNC